jgi:hypothetical protein
MKLKLSELREIVKQALLERAHSGTYTLLDKFNPHVHTADDVYHALMNEFYAVAPELNVRLATDAEFVSYAKDLMRGNVPQDVINQVMTRLGENE